MKKEYHLIDIVRPEDRNKALPDLTHTPIATIEQPYASLMAWGGIVSYHARLKLPSRCQNRRMYVRAASRISAATMERMQNDSELRAQLFKLALISEASYKKNKSRIKFVPFTLQGKGQTVTVYLPLNALLGAATIEVINPQLVLWHVRKVEKLTDLITVPGRGGIYYLRELRINEK